MPILVILEIIRWLLTKTKLDFNLLITFADGSGAQTQNENVSSAYMEMECPIKQINRRKSYHGIFLRFHGLNDCRVLASKRSSFANVNAKGVIHWILYFKYLLGACLASSQESNPHRDTMGRYGANVINRGDQQKKTSIEDCFDDAPTLC